MTTDKRPAVAISGLVVKPDVAAAQIALNREAASGAVSTDVTSGPFPSTATNPAIPAIQQAKVARRFYASASLDPMRLSRDASRIAEEVVQHLAALVDAKVQVRIELSAETPSGVPDNVVRTVTENCRTLKFDSAEFEES